MQSFDTALGAAVGGARKCRIRVRQAGLDGREFRAAGSREFCAWQAWIVGLNLLTLDCPKPTKGAHHG